MTGPISSPGSQTPIPGTDPKDDPQVRSEAKTGDIRSAAEAEQQTPVKRKAELPPQKNLTVSHANGGNKQDTQSLKEAPPRLSEPEVDANDPAVAADVGKTLEDLDVKSLPKDLETAIKDTKNAGNVAGGKTKKPGTATAATKAAHDAEIAEAEEATATGKTGNDLKTQTKGAALASQTLDLYKTAKEKFANNPLGSFVFEVHALEVRAQLSGLEDGPPELIKGIEGDLKKLQADIASGKISDPEEATLALMEMQSKLTDKRMKFSQETIEITRAENQKLHKERMQKIVDTIAKMKKAARSQLIGKIFGWIAVVAMAIATVALAVSTVLTGGATAPALVGIGLMIGATAIMLTMQVSQETGGWMNQIFGDSDQGKLAASIFWAVLVTVMSVGGSLGVGAAGGAAGAAGSTASTAANASSTAANTAATASTLTTKALKVTNLVRQVAVLVNAASQASQGASGIATASFTKDAEMLRADAKEIQAFILRNGQIMEETAEELKKLLEEMQEGVQGMMQIISASHDTKTQISKSIRA